jgi:hypothetical protein
MLLRRVACVGVIFRNCDRAETRPAGRIDQPTEAHMLAGGTKCGAVRSVNGAPGSVNCTQFDRASIEASAHHV